MTINFTMNDVTGGTLKLTDLTDMQGRLGTTDTTTLQFMCEAVEAFVLNELNRPNLFDSGSDRVAYPEPGDEWLRVPDRPLTAVTSVWYDRTGGYGQISDTFGDDTLLVVGDEYVALDTAKNEKNPSVIVMTNGGRWPGKRGMIKVSYRAGYDPANARTEIPDLANAASDIVAELFTDKGGKILKSRSIMGEVRSWMQASESAAMGRARMVFDKYAEI